MKEFVEGAITTNGLTLHYWRSSLPQQTSTGLLSRNRTRLTLVLLHGLTENGRCWTRVAEALRGEYNIVIPESRGHGLSEAPEMGYGIEDRAIDLAGLIETLELDRPVLIGYSLGAETAVGTAANYPHLVRAVVVEDPPWPGRFYGSTPEERAERAAKWREDIIAMRNTTRKELIQQAREQHPDWIDEELEPWAEAKKQVSPNISSVIFAPRRRWSDYVRETECPILLVTGDPAKGATVSEQTTREASLFMQNGRVANIPGAGHSIHREQLDEYLKALRSFLKQIR
jgi:pimeloyl-ACP methyl ester carboxylesterase